MARKEEFLKWYDWAWWEISVGLEGCSDIGEILGYFVDVNGVQSIRLQPENYERSTD
jgi:hypothetical protein